MTTEIPPLPRNGAIQLTNMALAYQTMMDVVHHAGEGSPRLALFYGYSGYGKTVAAAYCAAEFDACYIVARSIWTQSTLLEAIADGTFGLMKRPADAGKGLDGVVRKESGYLNPASDILEGVQA